MSPTSADPAIYASFDTLQAWYTRLATRPGWWAYAQHRVRELDADPTGLFRGLHAQVAAQVRATGYRPAAAERGEWWKCPSEAEREAQASPPPSARRPAGTGRLIFATKEANA